MGPFFYVEATVTFIDTPIRFTGLSPDPPNP